MMEVELQRSTTKGSLVPKKLDPQLDKELVTRAVNALLKYHQSKVANVAKSQLFDQHSPIQVHFALEVPPVKHNPKPFRLAIPFEIHRLTDESESENLEEPEVCLIVKDEAKPWIQEMIEKFPQFMGHIKKVLTLDSLRKKHNEFKKRRELMQRYALFMADDRIIPMLMKALGKKFWEAKKYPIPIRITRKESLPHMIRTALKATYVTLNNSPSLTVKAGFTGMPTHKLVENCFAIANQAAVKIPRGWANIRSIGIRTVDSALLPIYNRTPQQLEEMALLGGLPLVYVDVKKEDETEHDDEGKEPDPTEAIGKRQAQSPLIKALKKRKALENHTKDTDATKADVDAKQKHPGETITTSSEQDAKQKRTKKAKTANADIESNIEGTNVTADKVAIQNHSKKTKATIADHRPKHKRVKDFATSDGKQNHEKDEHSTKRDNKSETIQNTEKGGPEIRTNLKGEKNKRKAIMSSEHGEEKDDNKKKPKSDKFSAETDHSSAAHGKESPGTNKGVNKDVIKANEREENMKTKGAKLNKAQASKDDSDRPKEESFIASKSFSGSKKGYAFKLGNQGLGYYVDIKPVVDKAAIDAITRAVAQRKVKGNVKRHNSSKGKQRGRR